MEGNGSLLGHTWEGNPINLPSTIESSNGAEQLPPCTPPEHATTISRQQESLVSAQTLAPLTSISDPSKQTATASDASSVLRLQQNLQRLYGSLGQFNNHGSKSNLPNIQEDEEANAPPLVPPPSLYQQQQHSSGNVRAMSDDDLFLLDVPPSNQVNTSFPDASAASQLPTQIAESRTLFIRGVDPQMPDDILKEYFECFGDIHSLYSASKHRGFIMVTYHDIRAARLAQHTLHGQAWSGRHISCTFSQPGDGTNAAHSSSTMGSLVLVSLDSGRSLEDIFYVLSAYGELRELRNDPTRPHCCIAEFFDDRHAVAAQQGISSSPHLAKRLLALDANAAGGVHVPSTPNDTGATSSTTSAATTTTTTTSSAAAAAAAFLNATSNSVSGANIHHQQHISGLDLAGMTRNLSEMSLENANAHGMHGSHTMGVGTSTADLLSHVGAAARGTNSTYPLHGAASTGSLWLGQGAANGTNTNNTTTNGASLGSSPVGSAIWSSHVQDVIAAQHQLAAMQQQQQQQQHHQQQQQHALVQNAAVQAVIQQALLSQQAAMGLGAMGMPPSMNKPDVIGAGLTRRGFSDPSLGGRLARRPMDPVAEAERRAQQERLYGLDLQRIARGDDKRTTLMIKNIPNKYTQKMLLSLIEERFIGIRPFPFDFFYLPIDFKNRCNVGYAFINMSTPHAIPALVEEFHGRRWPKFNSEKVCRIAYARIQGKAALVQHFQNSSLLHEDKRCRPVLFKPDGEVEIFPMGIGGAGGSSGSLMPLSGSP